MVLNCDMGIEGWTGTETAEGGGQTESRGLEGYRRVGDRHDRRRLGATSGEWEGVGGKWTGPGPEIGATDAGRTAVVIVCKDTGAACDDGG